MNSTPVLSIIIPVYNGAKTLKRTLCSILEQEWDDYEVLVMDGWSTDGSQGIVEDLSSSRIQLFSGEDDGVYDAMNKGVERANGEWILILGSDDVLWNTHVLERVFAEKRNHKGWILGCVKNRNKNHHLVPDAYNNLLDRSIIWKNSIHQQGVFYHRSIFDSFRFNTSYHILGDYDLHLKLFVEEAETHYTDQVIALCDAGGLSKQFTFELYLEELRIKKQRLHTIYYVCNIPWVWIKFLAKKML